MFRIANLLILFLVLLCSVPAVYAEDVSTVAEKVKSVVKEKASCWKLFNQQERKNGGRTEVWVNWVCDKEGVVVYLYQESSVEAAARLFNQMRTAPVASPGRILDSYKFGDESWVSSYNAYSKSSYVFFRRGNIIVRIDSGTNGKATSAQTLRNAVRFAQLFDEQMRPLPNNSFNRGAK